MPNKQTYLSKKKCIKCGDWHPSSVFHKNSATKDGHINTCPTCVIDRQRKVREENELRVNDYKLKHGCEMCGYDHYAVALDFHHINPDDKHLPIARMRNYSWARLKKEIDKCIVLCAICHRLVTYGHITLDLQEIETGPTLDATLLLRFSPGK